MNKDYRIDQYSHAPCREGEIYYFNPGSGWKDLGLDQLPGLDDKYSDTWTIVDEDQNRHSVYTRCGEWRVRPIGSVPLNETLNLIEFLQRKDD